MSLHNSARPRSSRMARGIPGAKTVELMHDIDPLLDDPIGLLERRLDRPRHRIAVAFGSQRVSAKKLMPGRQALSGGPVVTPSPHSVPMGEFPRMHERSPPSVAKPGKKLRWSSPHSKPCRLEVTRTPGAVQPWGLAPDSRSHRDERIRRLPSNEERINSCTTSNPCSMTQWLQRVQTRPRPRRSPS
jgi:hypothetical protein